MSVFLMGVHDSSCSLFKTVAKCGNGHDDATIARLQQELDMVKISKVGGQMMSFLGYIISLCAIQDPTKVPPWLLVSRTLLPDFVIRDPKVSAVLATSPIHSLPPPHPHFPPPHHQSTPVCML